MKKKNTVGDSHFLTLDFLQRFKKKIKTLLYCYFETNGISQNPEVDTNIFGQMDFDTDANMGELGQPHAKD